MSLQTEYEFTLPKGYIDGEGNLHRTGVMRLATARDEIEPLRDPRVADNEAFLAVTILARVVTELGTLPEVTVRTIEGLFAADLAYLQDLYGIVNFGDPQLVATLDELNPESGGRTGGPPAAIENGDESPRKRAPTGTAPATGRGKRAPR